MTDYKQQYAEAQYERIHKIIDLKKQIIDLLAPHDAVIQRSALADAVAMHLALIKFNTPEERVELQRQMLELHIETVMGLLSMNEDMIERARKMKGN